MNDEVLGNLRTARALLLDEQRNGGASRDLSIALTHIDTAVLWRQQALGGKRAEDLKEDFRNKSIHLTKFEIQSGSNRQHHAEGLIEQLPASHEGRNTWLLNYGTKEEADQLRNERSIKFDERTQAAETR